MWCFQLLSTLILNFSRHANSCKMYPQYTCSAHWSTWLALCPMHSMHTEPSLANHYSIPSLASLLWPVIFLFSLYSSIPIALWRFCSCTLLSSNSCSFCVTWLSLKYSSHKFNSCVISLCLGYSLMTLDVLMVSIVACT